MFNLAKAVQSLEQLKHDRIHGLSRLRSSLTNRQKRDIALRIAESHSGLANMYEQQAEQEGVAISRCYKSRTMDFGHRLRKVKGQTHHPGGETNNRL